GPGRPSAGDDVVHRLHHGLADIDAGLLENRHQRGTELVEVRLGLPDVEHLQAVTCAEADVVQPALGFARARLVQPLDRVVVLGRAHRGWTEVDTQSHVCLLAVFVRSYRL